MSNAGQAVLGIVGGVAGFLIGGPVGAAYGFQLGLLAGSALFPTQLPSVQGPRLGDGQQTVSHVGAPIPWTHGTQTVGGIVIWASPIREEASTTTAGGKGGPEQSQTTYKYFRSFAILMCEGPEFGVGIGGVRRIWANGKVIFDRSIPEGVSLPDIANLPILEAAQAVIGQIYASDAWASKMTIYTGTEDQLPDPVIESFEGVGNVPAYRGYAYVVFDDVELKPEDGNRMPASWKFEVYELGDEDSADGAYFAQEKLYDWTGSALDPADPRNINTYSAASTSNGNPPDPSAVLDTSDKDSLSDAINAIIDYHGGFQQETAVIGQLFTGSVENFRGGEQASDHQDSDNVLLLVNAHPPDLILSEAEAVALTCPTVPQVDHLYIGSDVFHGSADVVAVLQDVECGDLTATFLYDYDGCFSCTWAMPFTTNGGITLTRAPAPPVNPADGGQEIPGLPGLFAYQGLIYPAGEWTKEIAPYHVLQAFVGGDTGTIYPLGPARPVGHLDDTQAFWEAAYEDAVLRGDIEAGLVYGVDYPDNQGYGWRIDFNLSGVDTSPISLATIVRRIAARVSERALVQFSVDVSDLELIFVIGYQLSRPMTARAAIEPLRQVGFFDVVESTIELTFPTRGAAAVATLTDEDMAAHFIDEERPPVVTTRELLELELPRQIRVHYMNPERDFDPGEELSPSRFDTSAESILDVDLAVAITPTQAAQCAEIIYRDAWGSRWLHQTQVDMSFGYVEAGDVLLIPVDGQEQRVRVPALTDRLPTLRALEMLRDDDGTYVSTAVGTSSQRPPDPIVVFGPVALYILDLPPLTLEETDAGLYAAIHPLLIGDTFRAANISRSTDNGGTYSIVASATTAQPVGLLIDALPQGPTTIFDEGNELIVELDYGTLESRTEADVLEGANAAAIGADGRWEIVQFREAELITGKLYRLTGLLRGRRGTEQYVGTSQAEDRFVFLDGVARVPMTVAEVGAAMRYIATPIGFLTQASAPFDLTGRGVSLKPFSPVQIEGERDGDGNLSITWTRRDRLHDDRNEDEDPIVMSEAVEDYEVDVFDSDGEVRRTISVSTTPATYTAEQQTDDFGDLQDSVSIAVYQISIAVGRGSPGEAVL